MKIDEIFDDESFDPKKLFDEKQYSTLIINRDGFSKKQNSSADLIESLLQKDLSRAENEAIFKSLKESGASRLLVDSIKAAEDPAQKAVLTAACWETGLDFTEHFLFFAELVTHPDFPVALEALSVVESCEGTIPQHSLAKALEIAEKSQSPNQELISDLINNIKSRIG